MQAPAVRGGIGLETDAGSLHLPRVKLSLKRPLFYLLLPVLLVLAFVGFPPPFAPPRATKAAQEQSQRVEQKKAQRRQRRQCGP